ncbi:MAG: hypothetical protein ACRCY8_04830 [Dermatophilaceae bacterium]
MQVTVDLDPDATIVILTMVESRGLSLSDAVNEAIARTVHDEPVPPVPVTDR